MDSLFGSSRLGGGEDSTAGLGRVVGGFGNSDRGTLCLVRCGSDSADGRDLFRAARWDEGLGLCGVGWLLTLGKISRFLGVLVRDGSGDFFVTAGRFELERGCGVGCGVDGFRDLGCLVGVGDGVAADFGDVFADEYRVSLRRTAGLERCFEAGGFSGADLVPEFAEGEGGR